MGVCSNPDLLKIVLIFKTVVNILKIFLPLILIVSLMIDITKGIVQDKEDKINAYRKLMPKKLIAAALFFLVPTVMDMALNIMDEGLNFEYAKCITNADQETINELYLSRAEELVYKVETSLSDGTFNVIYLFDAQAAVNKIKTDDDLKNILSNRLKEISNKVNFGGDKTDTSYNESNGSISGNYPYYAQYDSRWSTMTLNGNSYNTKECGCGITSLAMVIAGLNSDSSVTPITLGNYIYSYENLGCGTSETTLTSGNITSKYRVQPVYVFTETSKLSDNEKKQKIVDELKKGRPIILHVPGHYIVLSEINGDKISLLDTARSSKNGNFTIDQIYDKYYNLKDRCTNENNCGFHSAISYYAL